MNVNGRTYIERTVTGAPGVGYEFQKLALFKEVEIGFT
jgi:hypothetical protein